MARYPDRRDQTSIAKSAGLDFLIRLGCRFFALRHSESVVVP
jgi:hypothetical protein